MELFHRYTSSGSKLGGIMQSHMSDPNDSNMKKMCKRYIRAMLAYKALVITLALLGLCLVFCLSALRSQGNKELLATMENVNNTVFAVFIVGFFLYFTFKQIFSSKINNYLIKDCLPDKVLNYYYYVATLRNHHARPMLYVCPAARMMVFLGRFEEAARLLIDTEPLLSNDEDCFHYSMAAADLALDTYDEKSAAAHIQRAELLTTVNTKRRFARRLLSRQLRLKALVAEKDNSPSRLQSAYDYYNQIASSGDPSTFEVVRATYHLARLSGEKEEVRESYDFVARNGGTTWYAADAKKRLASLEGANLNGQ